MRFSNIVKVFELKAYPEVGRCYCDNFFALIKFNFTFDYRKPNKPVILRDFIAFLSYILSDRKWYLYHTYCGHTYIPRKDFILRAQAFL